MGRLFLATERRHRARVVVTVLTDMGNRDVVITQVGEGHCCAAGQTDPRAGSTRRLRTSVHPQVTGIASVELKWLAV